MDKAVPKTQEIYCVRNTSQPLQLKVRVIPCLCPPCITDEGECKNSDYTNPWRVVNLIPEKGANKRKYDKRKHPAAHLDNNQEEASISYSEPVQSTRSIQEPDSSNHDEVESDEELPDIRIDFDWDVLKKKAEERRPARRNQRKKEEKSKNVTDTITDVVTDDAHGNSIRCSWINETEAEEVAKFNDLCQEKEDNSDSELLKLCQQKSKELEMCPENIVHIEKAQKNHSRRYHI